MKSRSNKTTAIQFLYDMYAGNMSALGAVMHPECVYEIKGSSVLSAKRAAKELLENSGNSRNLFPDGIEIDILSSTAEENRVSVEAEGKGCTSDGTRYDNCYHFMFVFEQDRIISIREYADTALINAVFKPLLSPKHSH